MLLGLRARSGRMLRALSPGRAQRTYGCRLGIEAPMSAPCGDWDNLGEHGNPNPSLKLT